MNKNFIKSHVSKRGYSNLAVFRKRGKKVKKIETLNDMIPEGSKQNESKQDVEVVEKSGGKIYKKILTGMGNLDFSSDNVKKTKRENIKLII
jgi:hypothetical protein